MSQLKPSPFAHCGTGFMMRLRTSLPFVCALQEIKYDVRLLQRVPVSITWHCRKIQKNKLPILDHLLTCCLLLLLAVRRRLAHANFLEEASP